MKEISYRNLQFNPMTMISETWLLITAGNEKNGYNTMTASWGHLGSIWGHNSGLPTATVYIRPQRYTKLFVDREDYFTLSVMGNDYKNQLGYIGSHSGKDEDKLASVGLKPLFIDNTTAIEGAELIIVCRKLYAAPFKENYFTDKSIVDEHYPERDFHYIYIGEIVKVFVHD